VAGAQRLSGEHVDDIAIFGVHHGQHAVLAGNAHHLKDIAVGQAQPAIVGGKDLERRDALPHQQRNIGRHLLVEAGDVHVKTEIHRGFGVGFGVPAVDVLQQWSDIL